MPGLLVLAGAIQLIGLLTDFGATGPYVGEMLAVLARDAPGHTALSIMCDLPRWQPRAAAYLIAPLVLGQPEGTVFVTVVDPGVGTPSRRPVWLEADGRILVGPDNGLLDVVARGARQVRMREIHWRASALSASFHGRDLFAPVAARLAQGLEVASQPLRRRFSWSSRWPSDLDQVIYVDGFGNCITGRRASAMPHHGTVVVGGQRLVGARTFGDVEAGEPFWYANSMGLVEIACNQANASECLELAIGSPLVIG